MSSIKAPCAHRAVCFAGACCSPSLPGEESRILRLEETGSLGLFADRYAIQRNSASFPDLRRGLFGIGIAFKRGND